MNENRCVDLNAMGEQLVKLGVQVSPQISENLANMLECLAYAKPEKKMVKVMPKKNDTNDKNKGGGNRDVMNRLAEMNQPQKPVDVEQKMVNHQEFRESISCLKNYDLFMNRLGKTKSSSYKKANSLLQEHKEEQLALLLQEIEKRRENIGGDNCYWPLINKIDIKGLDKLDDEELEDWWPSSIPEEAQNSVVVNLFCMDDNYETRAQEFLKYAFSLYPDRDYIILT